MTRVCKWINTCLKGAFVSVMLAAAVQAESHWGGVSATDYPTIQDAIESLPESGGEVYIPAGHYELSRPLLLPSHVTLRGAGEATVLVAGALLDQYFQKTNAFGETPDHGILFNPTYAHAAVIKNRDALGNNAIRIENIRIACDRQVSRLVTGILIANSQRISIDNVTVEGCGASGILLLNSSDARVIHSYSMDNHNGIFVKGDEHHTRNVLVDGCTVRGNRWTGIYVAGGGPHGAEELKNGPQSVTLVNNYIEDHMTDAAIKVRGSRYTIIRGNRIDQALETGIEFNGSHDVVCTGNVVTRVDDGMNSKGNGCGIYFGRQNQRGNMVVSDNLVAKCTFGIWSETVSHKGTQQLAGGMAVVGNVAHANVAVGMGGAGMLDGVWMGNVALDNGQHHPDSGSDTAGMLFTAGSARLNILGNLTSDDRESGQRILKHGIIIRGTHDTISGLNLMTGAQEDNLKLLGNSNLQVTENLLLPIIKHR